MKYDQFVFFSAMNFILNNFDNFLSWKEDELIPLCSSYLRTHYDLTERSAERISINALGEVQAKRKGMSLKIDSEQVVYIHDSETRTTYALTASMLRKIAPKYGITLQHS